MDKRPQYIGPGKAQVLLSRDIYKRLGKGAKDWYITLYKQYTDMAKMVYMVDKVRQEF